MTGTNPTMNRNDSFRCDYPLFKVDKQGTGCGRDYERKGLATLFHL